MSGDELGRIRADLAVVQRAMGLRVSFGGGMLAFGVLVAVAAIGAAVAGLLVEDDWVGAAPFMAFLVLVPVGLYLRSRRAPGIGPEIVMQVLMSVCVYAVVWVAGSGYAMALVAGPALGPARTAGLYAAGMGLLFASSGILVVTALRNRERAYCLGLAVATLLAGMLLPLLGRHYSVPLAHGSMAIGSLAAAAIQWAQLREVGATHAAD